MGNGRRVSVDLCRRLRKILGNVEEGTVDLAVSAWTFQNAKPGYQGRGLGVEAQSWEGEALTMWAGKKQGRAWLKKNGERYRGVCE